MPLVLGATALELGLALGELLQRTLELALPARQLAPLAVELLGALARGQQLVGLRFEVLAQPVRAEHDSEVLGVCGHGDAVVAQTLEQMDAFHALDLRDFHAGSRDHPILPVLVAGCGGFVPPAIV